MFILIKAILFDFDGVLTIDKTGSTSITNYLSQVSGIPLEIIKPNYYKYNKALLYGETIHQEIWDSFCQDIGEYLDYRILLEAFHQTNLDNDMIDYIKELKENNYLIGMITDNKCDRIEAILQYQNIEQYFDVVSISAVFHSGKEEKAIFEHTLSKLNVLPGECVFIDNTEKNLCIPQQMGIHTILFHDENRDFIKFKKQLENILV